MPQPIKLWNMNKSYRHVFMWCIKSSIKQALKQCQGITCCNHIKKDCDLLPVFRHGFHNGAAINNINLFIPWSIIITSLVPWCWFISKSVMVMKYWFLNAINRQWSDIGAITFSSYSDIFECWATVNTLAAFCRVVLLMVSSNRRNDLCSLVNENPI